MPSRPLRPLLPAAVLALAFAPSTLFAQAAATAPAQADADPAPAKAAAKPAPVAGAIQGAVQTVRVKGAVSSYDPRRDDTASKAVISADEIRKYGDDNVFDVLKRAPGVAITGNTIRMRGLGAGYTQILVNGDRPPPGFSLDNLNPDQIERIEVIRAASAEYSMQAIAGTVNIVLRKLVVKPQRDLRLSASHSAWQDSANAGGTWGERVGGLSYFLNGSVYAGRSEVMSSSTDRFTDPAGVLTQARIGRYKGDGSWRGVGMWPRLSYRFDNGHELNLHAGLQAGRSGWAGGSRTDNLVGSFEQPDWIESAGRTPASQLMQRVELNWVARIADGKLDVSTSFERGRNGNETLNDYYTEARLLHLRRDWDTDTRSTRRNLRGKFTRSLFDSHTLGVGMDASRQRTDEERERVEQLGEAPAARIDEEFAPQVTRLAAFVQDEWNIDRQWSVYLGTRWEGVRTDSEATGLPEAHSRNHVLSPVAQTLYKFPGSSGRQLRLALTRTYKAPTIEQLTARRYEAALNTRFSPDSSGNPDLKPELANGIDIAYEHFWAPAAMFSLSASQRTISDYIRTRLDQDEQGRWLYQPLNDGEARVHTLEAELKLPLKLVSAAAEGLDMRASVSRNWSHVSTVPGPDNRLDGQTPMSANLGLDYRRGSLSMGTSLAWQQGGWTQVSEAQSAWRQVRRDLDAYALWKLDARFQLRLSLNNILGMDSQSERRYEDADGLSRQQSFQAAAMRTGLNLEMKL